jgi:DICT domain-containing protein
MVGWHRHCTQQERFMAFKPYIQHYQMASNGIWIGEQNVNISLYNAVVGNIDLKQILRSVPIMNAISHQIERQIIKENMVIDLYSGFQRLSFFEPQMARYRDLSAVCQSVTVFGVADVQPPEIPNIQFKALDNKSPLVQEWFLVVDTPEFWTVLATHELTRDPSTGERRFEGIWSFDAAVVSRATRSLRSVLGPQRQTISRRSESSQARHIAEIKARMEEQIKRHGAAVLPNDDSKA